jgi:hypothetical protein
MTWDASMPAIAVAGFGVPGKELRTFRSLVAPKLTHRARGESFHVPNGQTTGSFAISPLFTLTAVRAHIRDRRKGRMMRYLPFGVVAAAVLAFSGRGNPGERSLAGNAWQMGSLP